MLKHGLMIIHNNNDHSVTISTVVKYDDTVRALERLQALDTEFATRVTAFLAYYKLRGTLRVIDNAKTYYQSAHTIKL